MPARASRKLVIDLSTQRSIARASFHTVTPTASSACRMPSRSVTASKLPPGTVRTSTASGRLAKPGRASACGAAVSMAQADRLTNRARAPAAAKARIRLRECQSGPSLISAIRGAAAAGSGATESRERGIEQLEIEAAGLEAFAGVECRHDHLRRAEQQRIDGVEVALEALEDLGERTSVVARAFARQLLGELARGRRGAGHHQMGAPRIDDGVVGTAHRGDEVRMRRRERRRR